MPPPRVLILNERDLEHPNAGGAEVHVSEIFERLAARGAIVHGGDRIHHPDHKPQLTSEQKALCDRIASDAREAGLEPPALREWGETLGLEEQALRNLLAYLERETVLVRAPGDLFFDRAAVDSLRARVISHLRQHDGGLKTPDYKA